MTKIQEKKQLIDLSADLNTFMQQHGWIARYDIESDAFSITVPKLSDDARIKYFDDEIAFYVTNDNKVEGLFIEYFKANFIRHHEKSKKMEKVLNTLEKEHKDDEAVVKVDTKEVKEIAPDLQEAIKLSLASRINLSFS